MGVFILFQIWFIATGITYMWDFQNNYPVLVFLLFFAIIIALILSYAGYCLKKKRLNDLWSTTSTFSIKSQFIVFNKWDEKENEHWKRENIFNRNNNIKVIFPIFIVVWAIGLIIIISPFQKIFNANPLIIESKQLVVNNLQIKETFWDNIEFWNIWWSISTTNNVWNLSLNYSISWNDRVWKVIIVWYKKNWKWLNKKLVYLIWEEEYNLLGSQE